MVIPKILKEAIGLGPIDGCELLQDRISQVLSEPAKVQPERYEAYYKALGESFVRNEDEFIEGREEVLEIEEKDLISHCL